MFELFQMERRVGIRQFSPRSNLARRQAFGSLFNQQTKDSEPTVVSQRGEGVDDICRLHITNNIEVIFCCQVIL